MHDLSDFAEKAISEFGEGAIPKGLLSADDIGNFVRRSGVIRANQANCAAVAVVVNADDEIYFNFRGRGRE